MALGKKKNISELLTRLPNNRLETAAFGAAQPSRYPERTPDWQTVH